MPTPVAKRITPEAVPTPSLEMEAPESEIVEAVPSVEKQVVQPEVAPDTAPATAAELQHIQALRQGPLASVSLPDGPVSDKSLEEIKKLLFPNIDIATATPQQLVTYLLVNHSMDVSKAHDWVQFLAESSQE